jgi:hypothetical protein
LLIAAAWQRRMCKQEIEVGPAIPQTPWRAFFRLHARVPYASLHYPPLPQQMGHLADREDKIISTCSRNFVLGGIEGNIQAFRETRNDTNSMSEPGKSWRDFMKNLRHPTLGFAVLY